MKVDKLRFAIPLVIILLALVAYAAGVSTGTISQVGLGDISLLCPLGALSAMIASRTIIPRAVVSIVVALVLFVIFGRVFCGWACPVPVVSRLKNLFRRSDAYMKAHPEEKAELPHGDEAAGDSVVADDASTEGAKASAHDSVAPLTSEELKTLQSACTACGTKRGNAFDSRHAVLIAALVSTLLFGFPVFCLICPIGLTFATIFMVFALFAHAEVTWGVLVAPAVLLIEVVFYRKWCHTFCPLGALMSLTAKLNRTFQPNRDKSRCLEERGVVCGKCVDACSEEINLVNPACSKASLSECTRCRACVDACPAGAISIPAFPRKSTAAKEED